jgi:xanthine dehydrogenase accessory factor
MTRSVDAAAAARHILAARERGCGVVSVVILSGPHEGTRLLIEEASPAADLPPRLVGSLAAAPGASDLEARIRQTAAAILAGTEPPGRSGRDAGTRTLATRPPTEVYFEVYLPTPPLVIVGAGHLAVPLSQIGALLGFHVTVVDDRPEFARTERFPAADRVLTVDFADPLAGLEVHARSHVLLVTRGHRYDYEVLRRLLARPAPPRYIGMIGSRRRVRATFHQLREEGFDAAAIARVRAPVGLDLGAETPEEIAVAVAAELVQLRRGGTGRPLTEVEAVARRFFGDSGDTAP